MKKIRTLIQISIFTCAFPVLALAQTITIGSFDESRSRSPLTTATGITGYERLRASLLEPARFGPGGLVECQVIIAPGASTITAEYLADKDIFFASVFTGVLSADEASAIAGFVAGGGWVMVDSDNVLAEQQSANSLLAAIGTVASLGPATTCPMAIAGGIITGVSNEVTDGPFGNISGGSVGTSPMAVATLDGRDVPLTSCAAVGRAFFPPGAISPGSGLVMYGGDPAGIDLFTAPGALAFNPNNETMYLNVIASRGCSQAVTLDVVVDIKPESCPNPLNTHNRGVLPVAILGTPTIDATQIDTNTVRLVGVAPLRASLEDVAGPMIPLIARRDCLKDCATAGPDAVADLVLHFSAQAVIAALGSVSDGQCMLLRLTGNFFDGSAIAGEDVVTILKKK